MQSAAMISSGSRRKQLYPKALKKEDKKTEHEDSTNFASEGEFNCENKGEKNGICVGSPSPQEPLSIRCRICSDAFTSFIALRQHEKEHPDILTFWCGECEKGFECEPDLVVHGGLHAASSGHPCLECDASFPTQLWLEAHQQLHGQGTSPLACYICDQSWEDVETLHQHLKVHSSSDLSDEELPSQPAAEMPCLYCGQLYDTLQELIFHVDSEHQSHSEAATADTLYICPQCGKSDLRSEDALFDHLETAHRSRSTSRSGAATADQVIQCGLCETRFETVGLLQKHTLKDHCIQDLDYAPPGAEAQLILCEECGERFATSAELNDHNCPAKAEDLSPQARKRIKLEPQSPGSEPLQVCHYCDAAFADAKTLSAHVRQAHPLRRKIYTCEHCGLGFQNQSSLHVHMVQHYMRKESQYVCKACRKCFSMPDELQKHLIDMHAVQLYKCSLCFQVFEARVDIQVHFAVTHSNEITQYRCKLCSHAADAVFESELSFQTHIQLAHYQGALANGGPVSDVKPGDSSFACRHCSKTFTAEAEYHEHLSLHQAFVCHFCGEAFNVEYVYEKHMETFHHVSAPTSRDVSSKSQSPGEATLTPLSSRPSEVFVNHAAMARGNQTVCKCNICDEKCETPQELAEHKLQHCKVLISNNCAMCRQTLNSAEQFYAHTRDHHAQGSALSCVICRQSLASSLDVQVHARFHLRVPDQAHASDEPGPASEPQTATPQSDKDFELLLAKTPEVVGGTASQKCPRCSMGSFRTEIEFSAHLRACSVTKPFQCIKCQACFATEAEIQSHIATHVLHDGINHHCLLCREVFDSPSKLQCHLIEHSFSGCNEFQCYLCGSVFTLVQGLQQHMLRHTFADRPYDCTYADCSQKFFFRAELDNHLLVHQQPPKAQFPATVVEAITSSPALYRCTTCDANFSSHDKLVVHSKTCRRRKTSTASPPQASGLGISGFSARSSLPPTTPEPLDSKQSPNSQGGLFACPHCPKTFNSLSALQGHSHVHMVSRGNHRCDKCNKVFSTSAKLRNHQRQHNGDKPYICQVCSRPFSRKDNLKVHMRTHGSKGDPLSPGSPLDLYESRWLLPDSLSDGDCDLTSALPTMVPQGNLGDFLNHVTRENTSRSFSDNSSIDPIEDHNSVSN